MAKVLETWLIWKDDQSFMALVAITTVKQRYQLLENCMPRKLRGCLAHPGAHNRKNLSLKDLERFKGIPYMGFKTFMEFLKNLEK